MRPKPLKVVPDCGVCGRQLRELVHPTLGPLDGFYCLHDDYAEYGPGALEVARRREQELDAAQQIEIGGKTYRVGEDARCPTDGTHGRCGPHGYVWRNWMRLYVLGREFGKGIHTRLHPELATTRPAPAGGPADA